MKLQINRRIIQCTVERKTIKGVYLRMKEENHLLISCNQHVTDQEIQAVIEKNKNWILNKADLLEARDKATRRFGNYYIELGKIYPMEKCEGKNHIEHGEVVKIYSYKEHDKVLQNYFEQRAKKILPSIFYEIQKQEKIDCTLKLRKMKRRWGTCYPAKKMIILNKELLKLDPDIIRHVMLHEICHFTYIYHDKNFYQLLRQKDPLFEEHIKYLKTKGEIFLKI